MSCHVLWQMKEGMIQGSDSQELQDENSNAQAIIPAKPEQMVKKLKAYQCTIDFDHSFCRATYIREDLPDG
jgi:hypothetical protein